MIGVKRGGGLEDCRSAGRYGGQPLGAPPVPRDWKIARFLNRPPMTGRSKPSAQSFAEPMSSGTEETVGDEVRTAARTICAPSGSRATHVRLVKIAVSDCEKLRRYNDSSNHELRARRKYMILQ